jgi:hypothetical protein
MAGEPNTSFPQLEVTDSVEQQLLFLDAVTTEAALLARFAAMGEKTFMVPPQETFREEVVAGAELLLGRLGNVALVNQIAWRHEEPFPAALRKVLWAQSEIDLYIDPENEVVGAIFDLIINRGSTTPLAA